MSKQNPKDTSLSKNPNTLTNSTGNKPQVHVNIKGKVPPETRIIGGSEIETEIDTNLSERPSCLIS